MRRSALLVLSCAAVLGLIAPSAEALKLQIVNQSGQPDSNVYVTLFAGGAYSVSGPFQNNQPIPLSTVPQVNGTYQVDVNQLVSGRLYVSYGAGVNVSVPFDSPTRFDWSEFTVIPSASDVANLTRVDMFGIPLRLDTLDGSGTVLQTLSEANADTLFGALQAIPGGAGAVVRGAGNEIVRVLSPNKSSSYPTLGEYVRSLNGQTVTLQGRFFGSPQAVWNYSGTFSPDGSITLTGTTNPPGQAPASIPVGGADLIDSIATGGNTPNTAEGAIRRDLLAGFATGLWGGRYGNDDLKFCTNPASDALGSWCPTGFNVPAFGDARTASAPYATCEQYAAVINQLSDAYGNPYSDTAKPVQIGLRQPSDGGQVATLRMTILSDSGDSHPVNGGNPDCGAARAELGAPPPAAGGSGGASGGSSTAPSSAGTSSASPPSSTSIPPLGAVPALPVTAALPAGRALLSALNVRSTLRVSNPRSIVVGTAACPPVCGTVASTASVAGGRVVARDRTRVGDGQRCRLALALTGTGRRLLQHRGRVRTRLRVQVTSPTGERTTAAQRLTFRRRARNRPGP